MRKPFLPFHLAAAAVLAACAPGTALDTTQTTPSGISGNEVRVETPPPAIVEFPYHSSDLVWGVLPGVFAELKIPAQVMDAQGRVYGNARVVQTTVGGEPLRSYFRCSTDGSAASGATAMRMQFGITASPRPAGPTRTELIIHTMAHGTSMEASRGGTIACMSNGRLETKIKHLVEEALRKI